MIKRKYLFKNSANVYTRYLSQITALVVHHSGSQSDNIKSINDYHETKFKQGGITYHFVVDRDGTAYHTRPLSHVTSHCKDFNSKSIGVCFLGDFENNNVPYDAKIPFLDILNFIEPHLGHYNVIFHGDKVTTVCPGKHLRSQLISFTSK